uniref:Uncharacterized protein n=1 Tax=Arundo donax TaxID=35708 RepID=A0A0A9F6H7_ARUDO
MHLEDIGQSILGNGYVVSVEPKTLRSGHGLFLPSEKAIQFNGYLCKQFLFLLMQQIDYYQLQ